MAVTHKGCVVAAYLLLTLLSACNARIHKLTLNVSPLSYSHFITVGISELTTSNLLFGAVQNYFFLLLASLFSVTQCIMNRVMVI